MPKSMLLYSRTFKHEVAAIEQSALINRDSELTSALLFFF